MRWFDLVRVAGQRSLQAVNPARLRRSLGASPVVRRITDSQPIGRVIAAAAHGRLVRPSLAYTVRELSGAHRTARYRLRYGDRVVHLRHNTTDASILDEIFLQRIYEPPPAVDARLNALRRPLRIADLGANAGLFGAFAFERWPVARLLALEPHPQNAALLRRTIAANGLQDRWTLIEACAYTTDTRLPFAVGHFSDSHVRAGLGPDDELVAAIDVFPLLADIDLIKIDIEGGEWALLADPRLPRAPATAIAIEYHPHLAPGPDARASAVAALTQAGYDVHEVFHDPRGHGMLWACARAA
jgi:FkbM family methyltransferase